MYVYIQSEPGLWTTGFYNPKGEWHPDKDFDNQEDAAERTHYLNGGARMPPPHEDEKEPHDTRQ